MSTYRIERRREGQATEYWDTRGNTWDADVEMATVYSEVGRMADLNGPNYSRLPLGGCWVRLDGDEPTHTPAEEEEAAQLAYASGLGVSEWPAFLEMAREALSESKRIIPYNLRRRPPDFTVQHLALLRQAVAQTIADGEPSTPRVNGKPVWSTDWQLYAKGKAEAFVDAVTAKVMGMVAGTNNKKEGK